MLNKWVGMGRICNELELRHTNSGTANVSFTLAIERDFTNNGEKVTDFINVVAWRQTAEFVCKYFTKGSLICVEGMVTTRSYEKDGKKHFVTEIKAERVFFTGERRDANTGAKTEETDEFVMLDASDNDLPF